MSRDYTPIPHEYLEEMDCLSDAEYGRLIRGLQMYSITGEEPKLCGQEKVYWKRVRNRENRYQESFGEHEKAKTERAKNAANARWGIAKNANACTSITSNAKNANTNTNTNTNTKTNSDTKANKNTMASGADDFEAFWAAYPRKVGKKDAQRAFAKAGVPLATLLDALEKQKKSRQWTKDDGQYIPHPATWLNGRRWEDETQAQDAGRSLDADEMAAIRRMMEEDGNA